MMSAERGASANTLSSYRRDLEDYGAALAERGVGLPRSATTAQVRAYLASLDDRGFAASSAARRLSAVRQLHRFLVSEQVRGDDPTSVIDGPKKGARPAQNSQREGRRPADRHGGERKPDARTSRPARVLRALRLHALVELLYASGLRVSELVSLPASAARKGVRFLTVRGKGGHERMVPLTDAGAISGGPLPLGAPGCAASPIRRGCFPADAEDGHLTRQAFARDLKALAALAGISSAQRVAACAAACLRQPPPAERRGSARRAAAPRPRRYRHDADLHACAGGAAEGAGRRPPSARTQAPQPARRLTPQGRDATLPAAFEGRTRSPPFQLFQET